MWRDAGFSIRKLVFRVEFEGVRGGIEGDLMRVRGGFGGEEEVFEWRIGWFLDRDEVFELLT